MQITAIVDASRRFPMIDGCVYTKEMKYTSVIKRLLDTLRQVGVDRIVVLTGHEREEVEKHIAHRGTSCLYREPEETRLLGLSEAEGSDRVLVIPGNMPLISSDSLELLIRSEAEFCIPEDHDDGAFFSMSGELTSRLLALGCIYPDAEWRKANGIRTEIQEIGDPDEMICPETEADVTKVRELEQQWMDARELTWSTKLMISRGEGFFGPGVARFFTLIDETGSMSAACKAMEMSYSRGWTLVKNVEDHMGFAFLERKFGGKGKGYSKLTEKGRKFLAAYYAMQEDIERMSQALFVLHFGDTFD